MSCSMGLYVEHQLIIKVLKCRHVQVDTISEHLRDSERTPLHLSTKINILTHIVKRWEWDLTIYQRLGNIASSSVAQFSVKTGIRTADANFVIRTLCDKYREDNMHLDMLFVDSEGIYHTVPCEVL